MIAPPIVLVSTIVVRSDAIREASGVLLVLAVGLGAVDCVEAPDDDLLDVAALEELPREHPEVLATSNTPASPTTTRPYMWNLPAKGMSPETRALLAHEARPCCPACQTRSSEAIRSIASVRICGEVAKLSRAKPRPVSGP
ncbi:hypothetical protein GCM10022376_24640 [Yimella lutea]